MEQHPANKIPASIVKAIGAVMSQIEAVKKSQKNTHGGYMFASTDDIYAAVTVKMGEVGLTIIPMEERIDIRETKSADGKPSRFLEMVMHYVLATQEDTWDDPRNRRTIFVQITGPQTFQAAQSYCEKAFLRGVFKIPTGDMDIDSLPEGFEYSPLVRPVAPPPPPAAQAAAATKAEPEPIRPGDGNVAPLHAGNAAGDVAQQEAQPVGEGAAQEAPKEAAAAVAGAKELGSDQPAVDWDGRLQVLAATLRKMQTAARIDDAIERFHAAYDGDGMPGKVEQDVQTLAGEHKARVSRAAQ